MKFTISTSKRREVCELLACLCHRVRKVTRKATYQFKNVSFTAEGEHMAFVVKDTEVPGTVTVTIAFVDSKGKPAKVDGAPTWAVDDATIVDSVAPAADGMSAVLHITDTVGAAQLTVTADADLGSGVTTITSVDTVSVIAGDAVAANFTFGTVTPDGATGSTGATGATGP